MISKISSFSWMKSNENFFYKLQIMVFPGIEIMIKDKIPQVLRRMIDCQRKNMVCFGKRRLYIKKIIIDESAVALVKRHSLRQNTIEKISRHSEFLEFVKLHKNQPTRPMKKLAVATEEKIWRSINWSDRTVNPLDLGLFFFLSMCSLYLLQSSL